MKRSLALVALLAIVAGGAVLADAWRTELVTVTTNRMTFTLGSEYLKGCRFDGYWHAPNHLSSYTNTTAFGVERGRYVWAPRSDTYTNAPLAVGGLDLPVQHGDVLAFTNDFTTGLIYLHFRME